VLGAGVVVNYTITSAAAPPYQCSLPGLARNGSRNTIDSGT
jgi:hypothetical protein